VICQKSKFILTKCGILFTVKELSEEQKQMIILSEDFRHFIEHAGRIMERALSEQVDVCIDYSGLLDGDEAA
jgi:dynein intermediate chain, cytosolic